MLELKIPPVIVVAVVALLMWLCRFLLPNLTLVLPQQNIVALGLAAAGIAIGVAGVMEFRRVGTTVDPVHPGKASLVVRSGVFAITRNPMYLGLLLLLCGWAIFLGHILALLFLPVFVVYMNRFQIVPEERILSGIFKDDYADYLASVRRWI